MPVPIYHVDAFCSGPFTGNPAAVCLLEAPLPDAFMQNLAADLNLSETAFVVRGDAAFGLRWFTPTGEMPLCGHATLAAAHVLWEAEWLPSTASVSFETRSGILTARRVATDGDSTQNPIELDFPAIPTTPVALTDISGGSAVFDALGATPSELRGTPVRELGDLDLLLVFDNAAEVRALRPQFEQLATATQAGVIVTAPSDDPQYDFVSRYFACYAGVNEDPVTGSAHCVLAPYWGERLGKVEMTGYQTSKRGGVVGVLLGDTRVQLRGHATTIYSGALRVTPE